MVPNYGRRWAAEIYQLSPLQHLPSQHRPKGWTDSVESYCKEAEKLQKLLAKNRKLAGVGYAFHVVLNFEAFLTPPAFVELWKKARLALRRRGLTAAWVVEPTRQGKFHLHFLVRSPGCEKELRRIFAESLPGRPPGRRRREWRMSVIPVREGREWDLEGYVVKVRTEGVTSNGRRTGDRYYAKRLIFKANLGVQKSGHVGPFWVQSKKDQWQTSRDVAARIGEGKKKPGVRELAQYLTDILPGHGYREIVGRLALAADAPQFKTWRQRWLADPNPDAWASVRPQAPVESAGECGSAGVA